MLELQKRAQQILGLIDLTSLNDNDSNETIHTLCKKATTEYGSVPAICIFSRFIPVAKSTLNGKDIKIATVTNFPHGATDLELALFETQLAIRRGADEVDLVFPYHALIANDNNIGSNMVYEAKKICGNKTLKVIIESGELQTPDLIKHASEVCINNGADFIKTSTGKVKVNATLDAAKIMLNVIKQSGKPCGFKAAGGIKTVTEAVKYLELAESIMGTEWISSANFRFGASGLLNDTLAILNNTTNTTQAIY